MRWYLKFTILSLIALASTGCASMTGDHSLRGHHGGKHAKHGLTSCSACEAEGLPEDKQCDYDCEAKTLFSWATCKEGEKPENGSGEKKAENGNGLKPASHLQPLAPLDRIVLAADATVINEANGATRGMANILTNGTGNGNGGGGGAEEEPLTTDRPDFTEASTTVGKGRVQIETGYTYFRDRANGVTTHAHSYPEILARIGMFADWFELRLGQNFASESIRPRTAGNGTSGANDLYIGSKIALTEQKGIFPEMALILQATVPTGSRTFTSNKFLPGISLLYGWDLNERHTFAGSILGNKAVDDNGHSYTEFANSFTFGTAITEKIGNYIEYFAFYPHSATSEGIKPRYFMNTGFTYLLNPNVQFDVRAGVGLNKAADDFFVGSGLAIRF